MSSPHVFSIVDTAYTAMMEDGKNHSVIISYLPENACIIIPPRFAFLSSMLWFSLKPKSNIYKLNCGKLW
nr:IQ motif, EF-hand binding site [Ipomoea batatas]